MPPAGGLMVIPVLRLAGRASLRADDAGALPVAPVLIAGALPVARADAAGGALIVVLADTAGGAATANANTATNSSVAPAESPGELPCISTDAAGAAIVTSGDAPPMSAIALCCWRTSGGRRKTKGIAPSGLADGHVEDTVRGIPVDLKGTVIRRLVRAEIHIGDQRARGIRRGCAVIQHGVARGQRR